MWTENILAMIMSEPKFAPPIITLMMQEIREYSGVKNPGPFDVTFGREGNELDDWHGNSIFEHSVKDYAVRNC